MDTTGLYTILPGMAACNIVSLPAAPCIPSSLSPSADYPSWKLCTPVRIAFFTTSVQTLHHGRYDGIPLRPGVFFPLQ